MMRNLALDLARVRVNLISLGVIDTELWRELAGLEEKTAEEQEQRLKDVEEGQLTQGWEGGGCRGRLLGLMRDANVTGTIYTSDGGHVLL